MKELINQELTKLQDQLALLESAVDHIAKAEKLSATVVEQTRQIQQRYDEHLSKVLEHYESYLSKSQIALNEQLKSVSVSHHQQIERVNKLMSSYLDLTQHTTQLFDRMEHIDFASRLDTVDHSLDDLQHLFKDQKRQLQALEAGLNKQVNQELKRLEGQLNKQQSSFSDLSKQMQSGFDSITKQQVNTYQSIENLLKEQSEQQKKSANLHEQKIRGLRKTIHWLIIVIILLTLLQFLAYLHFNNYIDLGASEGLIIYFIEDFQKVKGG